MFEFDMIEADFTSDRPAAAERGYDRYAADRQLGLQLLTVAESEAQRRYMRR